MRRWGRLEERDSGIGSSLRESLRRERDGLVKREREERFI